MFSCKTLRCLQEKIAFTFSSVLAVLNGTESGASAAKPVQMNISAHSEIEQPSRTTSGRPSLKIIRIFHWVRTGDLPSLKKFRTISADGASN